MKKSANAGKLPGSLKREKTNLTTEHILAALQLPITSPANLQAVFIFNLMHLAGPRGGDELRSLHFGMFSQVKGRDGTPTHWVFDQSVEIEKSRSGGIRSFKNKRESINIEYFNNQNVLWKNPGLIVEKYFNAMPKGLIEKSKRSPLFPKPLATFKPDGTGFSLTAVRGKNWLRNVVHNTLTQLCFFQGHFSNHQMRSAMITGLLESGCTDEQVAVRSGHRDSNSLRSYHSQSASMKKHQTLALLNALHCENEKIAQNMLKRRRSEDEPNQMIENKSSEINEPLRPLKRNNNTVPLKDIVLNQQNIFGQQNMILNQQNDIMKMLLK